MSDAVYDVLIALIYLRKGAGWKVRAVRRGWLYGRGI